MTDSRTPPMDLDRLDRRLLRLVQGNARRTAEDLGAEVGLSASAVQRRLRRLRENGPIERMTAIVQPSAVGRGVLAVIEVTLESGGGDNHQTLGEALSDQPEVMQCYVVAGGADLVLMISARDLDDYERFMRTHLAADPRVKRTQTAFITRRLKYGLEVPVAD